MKLVGTLKDGEEKARSKDEAKALIEEAGIHQTDEEMEKSTAD